MGRRPGRRRARATSTSTVATVDQESIRYHNETTVLKPVDPSENSDLWPCFLVTDATIYRKDGELANQLHAKLDGPFVIRGKLDLEDDQRSYMLRPNSKTDALWVEIPNSSRFAFGEELDTGIPTLWASGASGWFEIDPSEEYRPMYDDMRATISMAYRLEDCYKKRLETLKRSEKDKKKRRLLNTSNVKDPMEEILFGAAVGAGDGATLEDMTERCRNQAPFLLGVESLKDTSIDIWLRSTCPDVAQKLDKRKDADVAPATDMTLPKIESLPFRPTTSSDKKGKGKEPQERHASRLPRGSDLSGAEKISSYDDFARDARRGSTRGTRPPEASIKNEGSKGADVDMQDVSQAAALLEGPQNMTPPFSSSREPQPGLAVIIDVLNEIRSGRTDSDRVPFKVWATSLYMKCKLRQVDYHGKHEIFQYYAGSLVKHLGQEWHNSILYRWLQDYMRRHPKPQLEVLTEDTVRNITRRQKGPPRANSEARQSTHTAAQPRGKHPPKTPSRLSGKTAGLRPSTAKKRARQLDHEEDGSDDDGMDMDSDDGDGQPRKKTARTLRFSADGNSNSSAEDFVIRVENIPTASPRGPGGTWTCPEPNCKYRVRNASEEEGKELVDNHIEYHEDEKFDKACDEELTEDARTRLLEDQSKEEEAQQRQTQLVDLAMTEGNKNHQPINHLLAKLREMHKAEEPDVPKINGHVIPHPLKRSLLV